MNAVEAVATYSQLCITMIAGRFFASCVLPLYSLPTGVVEVQAPYGVQPERCMPVFM